MNRKLKEDESEEVYDVEVVLDRKIVDGVTYYLLKWIGYNDECNTWEPEHNLNCQGLIEDFLRRPDKIIGATEQNGSLAFIVQTKSKKIELLPSATANEQCPMLVIEFFQKRLIWDITDPQEKLVSMSDTVLKKMRKNLGVRPDDFQNLTPGTIIGALNSSEGLIFLMKWQNSDQFDLIPALVANTRYTKQVLDFYMEKLRWEEELDEKES